MRFGLVFLAMGVVACSSDEDKSVRVEPESTPPTLNVTTPADGATLNHSDAVVLEATVEDNEDLPNEVALIWESDIDGVFSTDGADSTGGVTVSIDSLSAGDHVVTVTATDTDGLFVTDTVSFNLNEPPTAPTVTLEPSPATTDQMLVATVSESVDPEGTDTVTFAYEWLEDGVPSAESSSATFPAAATSKHHTYRVQVTASDERFESAFGYAETSVINAEPVLSGPALSSDTAVVGDVLTCTATATDADPTDSPTITYAWSDGSTEPTYTVTVSDAVGSTITCTATADDADGGIATGTATATVANTAPVGETVAVTPLEGQVGAILTCTATASDADGETPTMTYEWTGGATGPEYTIAETDDPGDVIACTATATDAHGLTDTGTATATVVNTDPTIDAVTIGPDPAYNNDTLVCSTTATDADGGSPSIAYEWTGGATGPELPLTSIVAAPGDTIACTATATDTDGGTDTGSASIVIGNRAPEVSSVTLSPSDVYTNDTITATATTSDDDGDSLTVTYDFSVDGTSVQDGSTNTLDGAVYFDKGQSVSVTVTADDGTEASTLTSDLVLVSNTTPTAPEVTILEGPSPIITSGEEHSCALSVTGEIDCWGSDSNGQVSGVPSASSIAVSAGGTHTCAISPEKEINCWGSDLFGQVTEAPSGTFVALAAGRDHHCALSTEGTIDCWGENDVGQVSATPPGAWAAISAGADHSCALSASGSIACWGGGSAASDAPSESNYVDIGGGEWFGCALTTEGSIDCWGGGAAGAAPTTESFTALAYGGGSESGHGCAITSSENVECWGDDSSGQVSDAPIGSYTAVSAGQAHTCALSTAGTIVCWGSDAQGQCAGSDIAIGISGLLCAIDEESTDDDGDAIGYTFDWDVDGTPYTDTDTTTEDGDTVPGDALGDGETWTCEVTPNDGYDDGDYASAEYVTESCVTSLAYNTSFESTEGWVSPACSGGGCPYIDDGRFALDANWNHLYSPNIEIGDASSWAIEFDTEGTDWSEFGVWFDTGDPDTAHPAIYWGVYDSWFPANLLSFSDGTTTSSSSFDGPPNGETFTYRIESKQYDSSTCVYINDAVVNCAPFSMEPPEQVLLQLNGESDLIGSVYSFSAYILECPVDADGDGFTTLEDCDDTDPSIYPYAGDTYGDGIDSDCDSLDCEAYDDGSNYYALCTPSSWSSADSLCADGGYEFGSIQSDVENAMVADLMRGSSLYGSWSTAGGSVIWLNYTDTSGSWAWGDGYSGSYTNWAPEMPDGGGCAYMDIDGSGGSWPDGTWDDTSCSGGTRAILCMQR
jgi:hypothetical protein